MSDFISTSWWVVTAASVPSILSGAWVFWRWWFERTDRQHDAIFNQEHLLLRDLEAQRTALSRDQAELFDRLRTELTRTQTRLLEVERDRDRGWNLARWWNQRAHEFRHIGLNAQTIVVGLCARENVCPPTWPDMDIPNLEDPP